MTKKDGDKLRPFRALMSLKDALETVLNEVVSNAKAETVHLDSALGRVVLEDITAPFDVPGFKRATMDGYAVIAEDTFGAEPASPKILTCTDAVYAGDIPKSAVTASNCIKIATGAVLPEGADAVVMVEDTIVKEAPDKIAINKPAYPEQNVGKPNEDLGKNDIVITSGETLSPSKIGALAAVGVLEVKVAVKPKVAVIPTGNEVVPQGEKLELGKVYDINSFTLASIISQNGGVPVKFGIAGDTEGELETMIKKALGETDMAIFSGGSSVGERDLLVDVFSKLGTVLFHGIQVKPGKPTLAGVIDGKIVFGMPGYPTSCLSNGYIFVRPVLRKLAGLPEAHDEIVRAKLSQRVVSTLGRYHFMTVKLEKIETGYVAAPVFKKSGAITSMAHADGYIGIESNVDLLEEGEEVEVRLL